MRDKHEFWWIAGAVSLAFVMASGAIWFLLQAKGGSQMVTMAREEPGRGHLSAEPRPEDAATVFPTPKPATAGPREELVAVRRSDETHAESVRERSVTPDGSVPPVEEAVSSVMPGSSDSLRGPDEVASVAERGHLRGFVALRRSGSTPVSGADAAKEPRPGAGDLAENGADRLEAGSGATSAGPGAEPGSGRAASPAPSVAGVPETPQESTDVATDEEAAGDDPRRGQLVAFYNIAFSSENPLTRHVGHGLTRRGWSAFVADRVREDLSWGFRRIQLHNPFGDDGEFPMELDQFLRAQEAGLTGLTEGFVEAWRPVVRGDYTDGEPVEVLAYLGTARLSPFEELEAQGDWESWLSRAEESVRLPLEAGMTLGFDSFSLAEAGSYSHRFAEILKSRGVRVYIETWPRRSKPHWADTNIVVSEAWFQNNHRRPQVFRRSELSGEIIRLLNFRLEKKGEGGLLLRERVTQALTAGYTIAVHPARLRVQVSGIEKLLENTRRIDDGAYD